MSPTSGPSDRVVRLAGGRVIGYAEYGDPGGVPLVNCHGGLSSRLDIESADAAARQAGVRVVSPDRPGIGRSSRRRGRSIADWATDVGALADELGLDRFGVFGWSFGGPYAAAVAALLSRRVASLTVVAGGVPLTWACAARGFENRTDAHLFRLSRSFRPLASVELRIMGAVAAHAPRAWMHAAARTMAPRDLEVIERDGRDRFVASIAEGLRHPAGAVDDYVAYGEPWGFAYESIAAPTRAWHGEEDTFLPVGWSRETANRIPGATLSLVPGCGHFVARDHWAEILATAVDHHGR